MKRTLLAVVCGLALAADAAECVRVFKPTRLTRGDTNIRRVQDIDDAAWIWMPGHDMWGAASECNAWNVRFGFMDAPSAFFRFRNRFVSDGSPLSFDVSADERFTLYLDGEPVARGPHRGLVEHWYYQSYEIRGLAPGEHLLEAVTWQLGIHAPLAQLSYRGGFILKAAGAYDAKLTTGRGPWEVARLANTRMTDRGTSGTFGVGSQCEVTGTAFPREQPAADAWKKAETVRGPVKVGEYGGRTKGWMLFPSERPDQMYAPKRPGAFRAARDGADGKAFYAAADADSPFVKQFNAALAGQTVTVPAHTDVRLAWDLDDYYCAYPELGTSGGRGAVVEWGWAESLRSDEVGRRGRKVKGNRDAFDGKNMSQQLRDTFRCDGRADAFFTAPWWRCGRWCELHVKTADEPLAITRLAIGESRYPLAVEGSFACDDPAMPVVAKISRRAMEMCMHEMLFDCPYYEQQMYPGDTRIQLNVINALTRDARMPRFAMSVYDYDRRDNGMVGMNFPTRGTQESATYTMCWILMFRDYLLWHDDAGFLRARMPGARNALMGLALHENAQGLLENLPGWSFMDWVGGPLSFKNGVAPNGSPRQGVSALNNLLYLLALQSAAAVDAALGESALAAHWRAKADRLGRTLVSRFWDAGRGALADTLKKDRFSEHAQCLAILADILSPAQRDAAFAALAKGEGLAPTSSYFAHYLFETYAKCGRADLIRARFSYWRDFVAWGARTAFETQHQESRSDCHAWSACPLYFMQTAFAGVTPDAPFFARVRVAPQPAGLTRIQSKTPHPRGFVETDLRFEGGRVAGTVTLPPGTTGVFVWDGRETPLVPGANTVGASAAAAAPVDVGRGRQLFVDDLLVASAEGISRVYNHPRKEFDAPVLWPETDLEREVDPARPHRFAPVAAATSGGLWWDPVRRVYRVWYEAGWMKHLCYAESADGRTWTRKNQDVVPGTNRVLADTLLDSWSVFPDYASDAPYANWRLMVSQAGGVTDNRLYTSADGVHWSFIGCAGQSGDRTTMFYDPFRAKWVFSLRGGGPGKGGRNRSYWASETFGGPTCIWNFPDGKKPGKHPELPRPKPWLATDELDLPDSAIGGGAPQLYNVDAVAYESILLGLFEILQPLPGDNGACSAAGLPKITDLHFAYSRDGWTFNRPDRTPAIAASRWGSGKWDTGYLSPMGGICVIRDERLWFYYTAMRGDATETTPYTPGEVGWRRNGMHFNASIGVASLRRDGFCGLVADGRGTVTTTPVTFAGGHLFVNAECRFGSLSAEVLDASGAVVPGFGADACEALAGADTTKAELRWRGADLATLAGKTVRLRFRLHCGTLYSFWVSKDATGKSGGYVAAGGPDYPGLRDI